MRLTPEALRFVLSGGAAAAANVVSRIFFSEVIPYSLAIIVGYGIGMVTAFLLMRRFVFTPSGRRAPQEVGRFALANACAAAQVMAVSMLLARWFLPSMGWNWEAETVAHIVGVGSTVLTSYVMHKSFTFRQRRGE